MPEYVIDWTPARLVLKWQGGKTHRVTLTGDREKVLYEGDEHGMGEAKKVYDYWVAHYEARKAAET